MKTISKGILTTLFLILSVSFVFAQKGIEDGSRYGHGKDSARCIKNIAIYRPGAKLSNYDSITVRAWKSVYTECPKATEFIYKDGVDMIELIIKKEKDVAQKEILIDSMMRIYDKRIKYYGKKGRITGYKGIKFITYSEKTVENMQIGYDLLKESITLEKNKSKASQLLTFMQASNSLYQAKVLDAGTVVADFGMIMEIADYVIVNKKKGFANIEKAKPSIEKIFEDGGAANCDDLIPYYAKKFEKTPVDIEFLKKSTDLLRTTRCNESELFFAMAVKLNSLESTSELAYELAKLSEQAENFEDAAIYYNQAIELEVEDLQKAQYYLKLSDVTRRQGNYPLARTFALKSIELDPTSGYPYLVIGNSYVASRETCGEKKFEQDAVYWVAVDKFIKAKKIDPELTEVANKYIDSYTPRFPNSEESFMQGFKQGTTYTVGCWINEKTIVRGL